VKIENCFKVNPGIVNGFIDNFSLNFVFKIPVSVIVCRILGNFPL